MREKVKVFAESDTTMVLIKPVAYGSDEDFQQYLVEAD